MRNFARFVQSSHSYSQIIFDTCSYLFLLSSTLRVIDLLCARVGPYLTVGVILISHAILFRHFGRVTSQFVTKPSMILQRGVLPHTEFQFIQN